jgi:cytochrome b6-f complex iron-sulfur subunit
MDNSESARKPKVWSEESATRRFFINFLLIATGTAAAAGGIFPLFKYLFPSPRGGAEGKAKVKIPLNEVNVGDTRFFKFKGKPAILIRKSENEVIALSAVCTHLGCIVKYSHSDSTLKCPCHGAKFDVNGKVLGGPAPTNLDQFSASIESGSVVVEEA